MFLKITRRGKVEITHKSNTQCWNKGWKAYFYEAAIECHEDNMDTEGFILDNMEIKKVIAEALQNHLGSCEKMAQVAGKALLKTSKEHGTMVIDLHITLYPADCDPMDCTIMEYSLTGKF